MNAVLLAALLTAVTGISISYASDRPADEGANSSELASFMFSGINTGGIPDAGPGCGTPSQFSRNVTFNVTGVQGNLTDVSIRADIRHSWVGDITASLIAPSGEEHILFSRTGATAAVPCGDGSDLIGTYSFADTASGTNWWTAAAQSADQMPTGSYRTTEPGPLAGNTNAPVTSLSAAFSGVSNPNGIWTLRLNDSSGGDTGTVESASLTLTTFIQPARPFLDFDGDTKTDISIFRPNPAAPLKDAGPQGSSSQWWVLNSFNQSTLGITFGTDTDIPVPADYTGDGKADVAFFRPATAEWFILRSEDFTFFAFPFGSAGDVPAPGDFDGDGIVDSAVYRPSEGTWYILRSSDSQTAAVLFGIAEDLPTVADFDGDGSDDVAVFRPSVQQWWLLRSSAGVIGLQFGAPGDKAVAGDYTGDGKADVAFYRPSTSEWFVLRSEDFSFFAFPWGGPGDLPVPGDYDGDSVTDPAVWRESDTTWYINGSTSGFIAIPFGSSGDVPLPNARIVP